MLFIFLFSITTAFSSLFLGVNVYAAFGKFFPNRLLFWVVFIIISQFYVLVRFLVRVMKISLPGWMYFGTSTIFAIVVLGLVTAIVIDIFLLFSRFIPFLKPFYTFYVQNPEKIGFIGIGMVFFMFMLGLHLSYATQFTNYTLYTNKLPKGKKVRIVQVADLHITSFTSVEGLNRTINRINALEPDIIAFIGDIVDEDLDAYRKNNMAEIFSRLKPKYGSYAVMGNHEYYAMLWLPIAQEYKKSFILLEDDTHRIPELNITVAGRVDRTATYFGLARKPLGQVLKNTDSSDYILLLDHQPQYRVVNEAKLNHVDLMLSGHTHNGQFFPVNLIVKLIFPKAWGHLEDGDFNLIVTCGYGTWGPPIRLGSYSEVVVIDLIGR